MTRIIPMHEQTAVLVNDHGEWVLITDDDKAERVWPDVDTAMKELQHDGWQVAEGPAPIQPSMAELNRFELYGYRLRRTVQ
jgi:hypothetical protein